MKNILRGQLLDLLDYYEIKGREAMNNEELWKIAKLSKEQLFDLQAYYEIKGRYYIKNTELWDYYEKKYFVISKEILLEEGLVF